MPIKVTKQTLEVMGTNLGVVTPASSGSSFLPFFKPNWRQRITLESSWRTNITQGIDSGAEERTQQYKRPLRTQTALITGMSQEESTEIQFGLLTLSGVGGTNNERGMPFPLYSDRSTLTNNVTGGSTTFFGCDTKHRRFYRGQRAALTTINFERVIVSGSILAPTDFIEIIDVFPNGVEATTSQGSFTRQDFIYPLIDIHPLLSVKTNLITDNNIELKLTVLEQDGASTLPPSWLGEINEFVDYSLGYPIFALDTNWKSKVGFEILRQGQRYASGRGSVTDTEADRPIIKINITELDSTKEEAWNLLRFFDSRQGRTKPFWLIQPLTLWDVISATVNNITVPDYAYLQNLKDYITHIGIELTDGTCIVKLVDSITLSGSDYVIDFTSDPLTTLQSQSIRRISPAWLSRFSRDNITQVWTTEGVSTVNLEIQQLLDESSIVVTNL